MCIRATRAFRVSPSCQLEVEVVLELGVCVQLALDALKFVEVVCRALELVHLLLGGKDVVLKCNEMRTAHLYETSTRHTSAGIRARARARQTPRRMSILVYDKASFQTRCR